MTTALPPPQPQLLLERRADSVALLTLVQLIHDDVKRIDVKVDKFGVDLTDHMKDETLELAEEVAKLMNRSFPEGDPDGHRAHHEAVIRKAEASAVFWEKMKTEIVSKGLFGLMVLVIGWAWTGFVSGLHK